MVGKSAKKLAPGFSASDNIKATKPALEAWCASGGEVQAYKPYQPHRWPDRGSYGGSSELGLASRFQVQVGTAFTYEKGSTPGGRKLNDALKKFGYYGRVNGGEDSDGDHVIEAQLIGTDTADQIPNMWPLLKHENRHGEGLEMYATVEIPEPPGLIKGLLATTKAFNAQKPKPKAKGLRLMIKKATAKT
jgi:hypothetical protein